MSFVFPPESGDARLYACNTCLRMVPLQVCKGTAKGNAGRLYASCNAIQLDGSTCSYFRWASPKSSPATSNAPSPTLPSSSTLATLNAVSQALVTAGPSQVQATAGPSRLHVPAISSSVGSRCPYLNCTSTRIAPGCKQRSCRKHCRQTGGCSQPGHNSVLAATSGEARETSQALSHDEPNLPEHSPPPPNQAEVANARTVDTFANPRYASQMPAIFTQQHAREQELAERRRMLDAERLTHTQLARHHVLAYCWPVVRAFTYTLTLTYL
jgi:hypothetical protein